MPQTAAARARRPARPRGRLVPERGDPPGPARRVAAPARLALPALRQRGAAPAQRPGARLAAAARPVRRLRGADQRPLPAGRGRHRGAVRRRRRAVRLVLGTAGLPLPGRRRGRPGGHRPRRAAAAQHDRPALLRGRPGPARCPPPSPSTSWARGRARPGRRGRCCFALYSRSCAIPGHGRAATSSSPRCSASTSAGSAGARWWSARSPASCSAGWSASLLLAAARGRPQDRDPVRPVHARRRVLAVFAAAPIAHWYTTPARPRRLTAHPGKEEPPWLASSRSGWTSARPRSVPWRSAAARTSYTLTNFGQVPLPAGTVQSAAWSRTRWRSPPRSSSSGPPASSAPSNVALGVTNPQLVVREMSVANLPPKETAPGAAVPGADALPLAGGDGAAGLLPARGARQQSDRTRPADRHAEGGGAHRRGRGARRPACTSTAVDLASFALLRAASRLDAQVEAIVDIGADVTSVVVHADGEPLIVRTVPRGGAEITAAIATRLGVHVAGGRGHQVPVRPARRRRSGHRGRRGRSGPPARQRAAQLLHLPRLRRAAEAGHPARALRRQRPDARPRRAPPAAAGRSR